MIPKAKGAAVQEYVNAHQDRSRNAFAKSIQAAFATWSEDLKSDQAQFVSEKLLCLSCVESMVCMQ